MAKTKFTFTQKMEIQMPKIEGKADTKKMQLAVNKAITRGARMGATYVEKGLREALDKSISSQWSRTDGSRDIIDTGRLKAHCRSRQSSTRPRLAFRSLTTRPTRPSFITVA